MKRSVLLLLAAALVAGCFAGCESTTSPSSQAAAQRHAHHQHESVSHMHMHHRSGPSADPR